MTDPIDTARAEGIALGLAMVAQVVPGIWLCRSCGTLFHEQQGHDDASCPKGRVSWEAADQQQIAAVISDQSPIPPHVAAARVLLDDLRLVTAMVDWADANAFRLSQVQGFAYGDDRLLFTARDCWLKGEEVFWQRQSTPETKDADHGEMMRQMEIYRVSLTMRAALEQIAKDGE